MSADDESPELANWRSTVRSVMACLPTGYADAGPAASAMRRIFHEELAAALEPRLNAHLKTMAHDTYADKKALASWVNNELHYVQGLTIRCPRTDLPAILVTDIRDAETQASRFRLEVRSPDGRASKTYSSAKLPELKLMEDPPRNESLSRRVTPLDGAGR
jgi:hypothetical protein